MESLEFSRNTPGGIEKAKQKNSSKEIWKEIVDEEEEKEGDRGLVKKMEEALRKAERKAIDGKDVEDEVKGLKVGF